MAEQLIKFRHGNHKGVFHYTVFEGDVVALSEIKSGKVQYIKEHGAIDIQFDLDGNDYDVMAVDIIEDKDYVQRVYDHMIQTNNAWFMDGTYGLCALKFHK